MPSSKPTPRPATKALICVETSMWPTTNQDMIQSLALTREILQHAQTSIRIQQPYRPPLNDRGHVSSILVRSPPNTFQDQLHHHTKPRGLVSIYEKGYSNEFQQIFKSNQYVYKTNKGTKLQLASLRNEFMRWSHIISHNKRQSSAKSEIHPQRSENKLRTSVDTAQIAIF